MISENKFESLGFGVTNNVRITIVDSNTDRVRQKVEIHNKATRQMVTGLLRFMMGHFTSTNCNDSVQYDDAKNYIPCSIGFGDGAVRYDQNGNPIVKSGYTEKIPDIDSSWSQYVFYNTNKMQREIVSGSRSKIEKEYNTFESEATADMDSIYFDCVVAPGSLNGKRFNDTFNTDTETAVFLTEIGLFPSNNPNTDNMLAYIKLSNYEIDGQLKTNILYVRPQDTIIIRWVITIAAIGKDSILRANIKNENGQIITNDVVMIPELIPVEIENIEDN